MSQACTDMPFDVIGRVASLTAALKRSKIGVVVVGRELRDKWRWQEASLRDEIDSVLLCNMLRCKARDFCQPRGRANLAPPTRGGPAHCTYPRCPSRAAAAQQTPSSASKPPSLASRAAAAATRCSQCHYCDCTRLWVARYSQVGTRHLSPPALGGTAPSAAGRGAGHV